MKPLLKGGINLVKRLIARGKFKTPKLFKRVQLGGILATGEGVRELVMKPNVNEVADKVVSKANQTIENGHELIELAREVQNVDNPAMAWALIIGGIVAVIVGRLPIKGSSDSIEGPEGDDDPVNDPPPGAP